MVHLAPYNANINVIGNNNRQNSAFIGASILSFWPSIEDRFITKEEY